MLEKLTKLHWILIGVIVFCLLVQSKEYFTIPSSGLTNTLRDQIKTHVFGQTRPKPKFQNFMFQYNKNCDNLNVSGKSACEADKYCQYTNKCEIKSEDEVLIEFNNKINQDNTFALSGY